MVKLTKTDKMEIREGMQQWVGQHFDQWTVGDACSDTVTAILPGSKSEAGRKYCVSMFWKKINKCISKTA